MSGHRASRMADIFRSRPTALLVLLIVLLLVRTDRAVLTEDPQFGDAMQNVAFGHRLAVDGAIANGAGDLSMYREPLPILLIAAQIRLDPRLDGVTIDTLVDGGPEQRVLKQGNLLWAAVLLAGVVLQLVRLLPTRHRAAGVVAGVLLVQGVLIEPVADGHATELPAAALLVWAGLAAQDLVRNRRIRDAVALGAVIGLAALVKASVLYVGVVLIVLLVVVQSVIDRHDARRVVTLGVTALLLTGLTVSPWIVRNAVAFDTLSIADRGGISLWYRAIYEQATPEEIRGSWYVFTPNPARPIAGRLLGFEQEDLDGRLRRVHRFHPDESEERLSFYSLARNDRRDRAFELRETGRYTIPETTLIADRELMARGLEVLRRDPWLFVRTTPLFLYRGVWPVLRAPLVPVAVLALLGPLGMLALIAAAVTGLVRLRPQWLAVVALPFGIVAFSALLTMYEPRFTQPAVPTMLILLVVASSRLLLAARARLHGPARPRH